MKTPRHRHGDSAPAAHQASADLDAYRRNRKQLPGGNPSILISTLDALKPSGDPRVTFARLAEVCVPAFCDGCQVELDDGVEPLTVHVSTAGDSVAWPVLSSSEARGDVRGAIEVAYRAPSRGGQPSYACIATFWWCTRAAGESDRTAAELLVRHAAGVVDRQRLMERVGTSETRAASAAMNAIVSRQVNLAVGILMARLGGSAADAEAALIDTAEERGLELYTVAAELVRAN